MYDKRFCTNCWEIWTECPCCHVEFCPKCGRKKEEKGVEVNGTT